MIETARRVVLVLAAVALFGGCRAEPAPETGAPTEMVFVDSQTKKVVLAEPTDELPALNPETGRRTLMPGLYCSHCRTWHPAPPVEVQQRNPKSRLCPKDGKPLSTNGPIGE